MDNHRDVGWWAGQRPISIVSSLVLALRTDCSLVTLFTRRRDLDVLISSPMRRARETAEILTPALGVPVLIDEGVQGLRLGACEGLTWDEIGARFGHPEVENEPFRRFAPDADSPASFAVRTCEGLDRLTRHYEGKTIVIVAHSEVVEMTFRYFLRLPLFHHPLPVKFGSAPTAITHWRKGSKQWTLVQFNDHMHLPE